MHLPFDLELELPVERIGYDDAMARFGVDAPDLRYGLELLVGRAELPPDEILTPRPELPDR